MTEAENQLLIWSLTSSAMRRDCPVFSAAAEREMEKFSSSATASTFARVLGDTRSGRVNERETVEMETFARLATSWIVAVVIGSFVVRDAGAATVSPWRLDCIRSQCFPQKLYAPV